MRARWIKIWVLIALTFSVSGTARFVHVAVAHDGHLPFFPHSSRQECPICQALNFLKGVVDENPPLLFSYQLVLPEVRWCEDIYLPFACPSFLFARPPPVGLPV